VVCRELARAPHRSTGGHSGRLQQWREFAALLRRHGLFINPDLTIHVSRLPIGEWVGLESCTLAEPQAIGISESRLCDEEGPVRRSIQSL